MINSNISDIVVLGGGPGGYAAAILATKLGAKVTLIEKNRLGGTCVNVGCIPTKALKQCADAYNQAKMLNKYGVYIKEVNFDFKNAMTFKEAVINQLVSGVNYLVKSNKINLLTGEGHIMDNHTITVKTKQGIQEVKAHNIIIATGADEIEIPGFETDGINILNSTQMLSIQELPKELIIIGGGVIGVEFASLFHKMGVEVTIIELTPNLIPTEDQEISDTLKKSLIKDGITVYTNCIAQSVNKTPDNNLCVKVKSKNNDIKEISCDKVLVCVGRKAKSEDAGIKELGVELEKDRIVTDMQMKTNIDSIYAVGDITQGPQLAHVAYSEARTAVFNIMSKYAKMDYTAVPHCIFTTPEIASVGLTEKVAREKYEHVKIARFPLAGNGKAVIEGYTDGFIKMIIDQSTEKVLGASIIGGKATELISEVTLAINNKMSISNIAKTIHAHPTLSEITGEVVLMLQGLNLHIV